MAVCVDVGSTYTKLVVVDVDAGRLVATAEHPTTASTDVLHGLDAARSAVAGLLPDADLSAVYACSSAGGGLRLAVVGYEAMVSAEAGHRVALSAGARVVHVASGRLGGAQLAALRAAGPDVVLLVGGTDGGDAEVLRHNAARLAAARVRWPVVVAGNVDVRDEVLATLTGRGVPAVAAANVLPRIGVLEPQPARSAIREVFLRHVIGGKKLSRGRRFAGLVRGATPDVVLRAVEVLADHVAGDLLVVDVGGATTDVYSVVAPDEQAAHRPQAEVAGTLWRSRTVEGDLGVRSSATGVVAAAEVERLVVGDVPWAQAARRRAEAPAMVPADAAEQDVDLRLAQVAATVALRRHARGEAVTAGGPRRGGRDLSGVRLVIGSGGVLRHAPVDAARRVLSAAVTDTAGGWALPRAARAVVDVDYVLAAAGLLADEYPDAAVRLLADRLGLDLAGGGQTRQYDTPNGDDRVGWTG
ncbi:MAG TPA: glutamate mutase L [Micromonosporaceae bacterium]